MKSLVIELKRLNGQFVCYPVSYLSKLMRKIGLFPLAYCDDNEILHGKLENGIEIISIESVLKKYGKNVPIAILSKNHRDTILSKLLKFEFQNILELQAGITSNDIFDIPTWCNSYYALDDDGNMLLRDGTPYRDERLYSFHRKINPYRTALIVMDPWVDMPTEHLNNYLSQITKSKLLPVVDLACKCNYQVLILTNDPTKVNYATKIHPFLQEASSKQNVSIMYHQDVDDNELAFTLKTKGIDSIIYTGYASNMCLIGRQMGMINMRLQGFKLFFIPEASAACEMPKTWESGITHKNITEIISQWIAEIINFDNFIEAHNRSVV